MSEKTINIDVVIEIEDIENKIYKCHNADCSNNVFSNEHSLKKHIILIHNKISSSVEKTLKIIYRYYCPISTCRRNNCKEKEFFTSRKYVIQHYYKAHNSERFVCSNFGNFGCEKKFSTELLKNVHEKSCGKVFSCDLCNCSYNSNEALLTHRKRKIHLDSSNEIKSKKKKIENAAAVKSIMSVGTNTITSLSKSTTTDEAFLAQKTIKNSSTSTSDYMKEENSNSLSSSSSNQNKKSSVSWNVSGEFEEDSITLFDSTETQTDFTESLFNNNFINNFTQTTFTDFDDFEKFDIQTQTNWEDEF